MPGKEAEKGAVEGKKTTKVLPSFLHLSFSFLCISPSIFSISPFVFDNVVFAFL